MSHIGLDITRVRTREAWVILWPLLLLGLLSAPARAASDETRYTQAKTSFATLLKDKRRSRLREPYVKLLKRFDGISQKGDAKLAPRAAFMAARVAEELSLASRLPADLDQALDRYQKMAAAYPQSSLADDALLTAARMALARRGDEVTARSLLSLQLDLYGQGDMAAPARELLARLPDIKKGNPSNTPKLATASKNPAVDRIGELLKKAELIRVEASDPDAPAAAVLEAEARLRTVEKARPQPDSAEPSRLAMYQPQGRPTLPKATPKRLARIHGLSVKKVAGGVEIRVKLDREVAHSGGDAPGDTKQGLARRAYFDLEPAKLVARRSELRITSPYLKRVRAGQNTLSRVRIVFDMRNDIAIEGPVPCPGGLCFVIATPQPVPAPKPQRLAAQTSRTLSAPPAEAGDSAKPAPVAVLEEAPVAPEKTAPEAATGEQAKAKGLAQTGRSETQAKADPSMLPHKSSAAGLSLSQQVGLHVRTIVIDAGHGGRDPGAIGPTGLREKNVTLKIAKRLAGRLKKELGVKVILTRSKDSYVSLERRAEIANKAGADLFISVHINASPNRRAYGVETFYLNTTDDRYAIRLAARENAGSEKSIGDLQFILADLVTKSNVDDSRRLAKAMQRNVVAQTRKHYSHIKDLGLKHALFYVLIGVRMPSVLVETAFISNRRDEKRLRSDRYIDTVVEGLVRGVRKFVDSQDRVGS